jgi:hypothetical protein
MRDALFVAAAWTALTGSAARGIDSPATVIVAGGIGLRAGAAT